MDRHPAYPSFALALIALVLPVVGCEPPPLDVTTGAARVSVNTTGGDRDRDGYRVVVDAIEAESIGVSATAVLAHVPTGTHIIGLDHVAPNCAVAGDNPVTVLVTRGDTAQATFAVSCVATGVQLVLGTTGIDVDADGYLVSVDTALPVAVAVNGIATITYLSAGQHTVTVSGVSANCQTASALTRTVNLSAGQVATESFAFACVATTGMVEVSAATTGVDLDANGYSVQVDGVAPQLLPGNGIVRFPGLSAGDHSVTVSGAAANCTFAGSNPRTVPVTAGGSQRDTSRTTFAASCGAITGAIAVTFATTGLDVDSGYTLQLDGGAAIPVQRSTTWTVDGLSAGDHVVRLGGLAGNCSAGGANPRTLTVVTGGATRDTARTTFAVSCVATTGSIEVIAATSGGDPDPNGYSVQLDGGSPRALPANGAVTFDGVSVGSHNVAISGVAGNCSVTGNPRAVPVIAGGIVRDTTRTTFDVSCVAISGSVRVTAATGGVDLDLDGYSVRVFGLSFDATTTVVANGVATMTGVPAGDHLVWLIGLALNCALAGPNPRAVTIVVGGTANLAFDVTCSTAMELAVALNANNNTDIYVLKANGAGLTRLTNHPATDWFPAWAPGGARIAFASDRDGNSEIYVMNADGSGVARLTNNPGSDYYAAFSPDGSKIAFLSDRSGNWDIWVMNADGTNLVRLTSHAATDADPVWSPDGLKIAFWSQRDGNGEIYVMNADGSNQTRLTTDPTEDIHPDWSPDGSKIVFSRLMWCYYSSCDYDLVVMNADGSGQAMLPSSSSDTDPVWSPDGQWIAFGATICDYYYGCWFAAVMAMRADGARLTEIANGASHPAWRR